MVHPYQLVLEWMKIMYLGESHQFQKNQIKKSYKLQVHPQWQPLTNRRCLTDRHKKLFMEQTQLRSPVT